MAQIGYSALSLRAGDGLQPALLQGFMTAVLQTYARQTMTPIDSLKFRTHVLEKDKDDLMDYAEIGTYIYGLFMEGAKWDKVKKEVAESDPSILYFAMPAIWHALRLSLVCTLQASPAVYPAVALCARPSSHRNELISVRWQA